MLWMIGVGLIVLGFIGKMFAKAPFLAVMPVIPQILSWLADSFPWLVGGGLFISTLVTTKNPITASIVAIIGVLIAYAVGGLIG